MADLNLRNKKCRKSRNQSPQVAKWRLSEASCVTDSLKLSKESSAPKNIFPASNVSVDFQNTARSCGTCLNLRKECMMERTLTPVGLHRSASRGSRPRPAPLLGSRHPLRYQHVVQSHQLRIRGLLLLCVAKGQNCK